MTTNTEGLNPITEAVDALTAAARTTWIMGKGTTHEQTIPADFAEIACQVITAVAANIGSTEELLAGRSGSWEANLIRQIIGSTAGHENDDLLPWRTEPVRIVFDVEDIFMDFGIYDLYEEAADELGHLETDADNAIWEALATPEEREHLARIQGMMPKIEEPKWDEKKVTNLFEEAHEIIQEVHGRATEIGHPLLTQLAAAQHARETLERQWEQDQASYAQNYATTLNRLLSKRGAHCGVEIVGYEDATTEWDELAEELGQAARKATPLPMSGAAPDWTNGSPADALRRAKLTYQDRTTN